MNAPSVYPSTPRTRELPPALAKALEPKLERAISLQLSDFVEFIPAEYVKPVEVIDGNRPVTLKASEIEKGMPVQQPSISLTSLYQQIPEIFLRSVAPTDETRVLLPYEKVLEQFSSAQVRSDQQRDDRVPQLETPILQATIEDTERFGTKIEPVESSALPPVPVEPATAETIASAEPEPAIKEIIPSATGKKPHPVVSLAGSNVEPAASKFDFKASVPPASKIPFQFPPNGTGAPASERVPASSGPPVPPPSFPPLKLTPDPAHEELEKTPSFAKQSSVEEKAEGEIKAAPVDQLKASETLELLKLAPDGPRLTFAEQPDASASEATVAGAGMPATEGAAATISLALKPVLENLPIFQRIGDIEELPDSVRVQFAVDLIQSQLASGRVLVPAKAFQLALAPAQQALFVIDPEETPVSLPLQEVLKNLPADALKLREDQQKSFAGEEIVTPFSMKAKEDATRLQPPATQVATATAPATVEVKKEPAAEPSPAEEKVTGKQVVADACELPGVAACELMFPDGLSLAGDLPTDLAADGLCAMAPTLLQRISTHMLETKLGRLDAMTLYATNHAITFFMAENICLAALHKDLAALPSESRAKLNTLVEKLSRTFTQPEMSHVDH